MNKFSINDKVKVRLTRYGNEVLENHFDSILFVNGEPEYEYMRAVTRRDNKADNNGYHTMLLWQLMGIFGSAMPEPVDSVFENDVILLGD